MCFPPHPLTGSRVPVLTLSVTRRALCTRALARPRTVWVEHPHTCARGTTHVRQQEEGSYELEEEEERLSDPADCKAFSKDLDVKQRIGRGGFADVVRPTPEA